MRFIKTLLLILALCTVSYSKQGISKETKLYHSAKIWGFLKYYHPTVGKGVYDWDSKLQELLNRVEEVKNFTELSNLYIDYINELGEITNCKSCVTSDGKNVFEKNFDLSWTQTNHYSEGLRFLLKRIENNRFQGDHYYIGTGAGDSFQPTNEKPHYDLDWSEEKDRVLVLFRYWNIIEYFFPYKYKTDQPWDDVLKEMIGKFIAAKTEMDFHLAMLEMVVKIDDSHGTFMTPTIDSELRFNYLPASFQIIENQLIITHLFDTTLSNKEDLNKGDLILKVNGEDALQIHKRFKKYLRASNESVKNRSAYFSIFMGIKDSAMVTFKRNNIIYDKVVSLYSYEEVDFQSANYKPAWSILHDSVGYVNMGVLEKNEVDSMMKSLMNTRAIIFDIRNYPKGTMFQIAKYLKSKQEAFAIFTKPDYSYPGKFLWSETSTCGEINENFYKGKIILLVNEQTQSHAEFTCMCLQTAPNATIIGSQTSGADGFVSRFAIVKRYYTSISGVGVYYPDKGETQRIGIVPDIEVKPTIAGIKDGRDEVLDRAIAEAQKN